MKKHITVFLILMYHIGLTQSERVLVTETTVKILPLSTQSLYFGFNKGDKVVVNLELIKGESLKEFEVFEYPGSSVFKELKASIIENKLININSKGIYKFNFKNRDFGTRVCKVKIERIPSEMSEEFNTNVYWKTISDTTTSYKDEKYLISRDTNIINVAGPTIKVNSQAHANGNVSTYNFSLPKNTISWSYYIGVDQSGIEAYDKASQSLSKNIGSVVSQIPGYGPLAALMLDGNAYISKLQTGEDVEYVLLEGNNITALINGDEYYYLKRGQVINDFAKIPPSSANLYFYLKNNNLITGISVTIKVVAITVVEKWGDKKTPKHKIKTREEPYLKN